MRQTARRQAITTVRPSPARAQAPEPDAWIPILDLELLEALGSAIDPALLRELDGLERCFLEPPAPQLERRSAVLPAPARARASVPERLDGGVAALHPHHRFLHWVILAVALAVIVAGVPYFLQSPAQRRVTLDVDGASFVRTTRIADVAGLLESAGVAIAPGDQVTPAPGRALRNGATVRVVRAIPVSVDVDGAVRAIRTTARTVKRLRRELEIPAAMVAVGAAERVRRNETIVFRTSFDVTLVTDGVAGSLTSTSRTVGEMLAERGVLFAAGDQIDPPLDAPLTAGLTVTVTRTTAARPEIVAVGTQPIGGAGHQTGIATWYATLYQPGTCAHLHLPFGTMVRVTDPATGASATCRVADRGPEAWTGNIIDLSPDVFEQLQPLSTGEVNVRLDY